MISNVNKSFHHRYTYLGPHAGPLVKKEVTPQGENNMFKLNIDTTEGRVLFNKRYGKEALRAYMLKKYGQVSQTKFIAEYPAVKRATLSTFWKHGAASVKFACLLYDILSDNLKDFSVPYAPKHVVSKPKSTPKSTPAPAVSVASVQNSNTAKKLAYYKAICKIQCALLDLEGGE